MAGRFNGVYVIYVESVSVNFRSTIFRYSIELKCFFSSRSWNSRRLLTHPKRQGGLFLERRWASECKRTHITGRRLESSSSCSKQQSNHSWGRPASLSAAAADCWQFSRNIHIEKPIGHVQIVRPIISPPKDKKNKRAKIKCCVTHSLMVWSSSSIFLPFLLPSLVLRAALGC